MPLPSETFGTPVYDPRAHYDRICERFSKHPINTDAAAQQYGIDLLKRVFRRVRPQRSELPNDPILEVLHDIVVVLFVDNHIYVDPPPPYDRVLKVRDHLDGLERQYDARRIEPASKALTDFLSTFLVSAPPAVFQKHSGTSEVPLIDLFEDAPQLLTYALNMLCIAKGSDGEFLFPSLYHAYLKNIAEVSGRPIDKLNFAEATYPHESALVGAALIQAYLKNTPFLELFMTPVPFHIPNEVRFEHTHIIGGAGVGKTSLIANTLLDDLKKPNPPATIIVDPHGQLLDAIQHLALFDGPLGDRLLIVDPSSAAYPPALNMFHTGTRLAQYSDEVRRDIENNTISLYGYVFGSIASALTQKQSVAFSFVVRLLFSIPGATIHTLLELMEEELPKNGTLRDSKFASVIARQPLTARRFFEHHFYHPTEFRETKQQIAHRLYGILQYPEFEAMFSTPQRKLDMFDAMQTGKIVLVNASRGRLGKEGSALFARYIIALVFAAAFERGVAKAELKPALLVVDEAADFFDDQIEGMLDAVRKFGLGLTFAHQRIEGQLSLPMRSALAANTSIKYAAGVSAHDAQLMAKDMYCEPEFIMAQRKRGDATQFACYVRNQTPHAVSLTIPLGRLSDEPRMNEAAHDRLLVRNRERVSLLNTPTHPPSTRTAQSAPNRVAPSSPDAGDPASEW